MYEQTLPAVTMTKGERGHFIKQKKNEITRGMWSGCVLGEKNKFYLQEYASFMCLSPLIPKNALKQQVNYKAIRQSKS